MQSTDYVLISRKDLRALLDHSWISDRDQYYRLADAMNGPAATVSYEYRDESVYPPGWVAADDAHTATHYRRVGPWLPVPEVDHDDPSDPMHYNGTGHDGGAP